MLRLVGSALETDAFGGWQAAWPQVAALSSARVVVHGYVRGATNTLGALDVESVFFNDAGKINTALVYAVSAQAAGSGSRPIGFRVSAPHFGGFAVTPRSDAARTAKTRAPATIALGDAGGRLAPGLYVMVLDGAGRAVDASQYVYTGYN
ncbi:MAG TPA: hypothetical protein VJ724_04205, partial [Tahibacter sp.]|nr:hypothetical protein [Tahibacter sp.]